MKASRSLLLLLVLWLTLSCQAQSVSSPRVQTISFKSNLVGATLPYIVLLPPSYEERGQAARPEGYPVLYLLHGLGGSYDNWTSKTRLKEYAAQYQMIVVTPEGNDGWYTDSATVAADKYESYLVTELIPDVENRFRVIKNRQGRAIAGLSMGGYGALKFGVKYPDKFIFAASLSGALDAAERSDKNQGFIWAYLRPSILRTFGPEQGATRAANNLHQLFRAVTPDRISSLPFVYLDCGTEDGFVDTNRALSAILLERKIPHEYRQVPGNHGWAYWDQQVREVLELAAQRMAKR